MSDEFQNKKVYCKLISAMRIYQFYVQSRSSITFIRIFIHDKHANIKIMHPHTYSYAHPFTHVLIYTIKCVVACVHINIRGCKE